MPSKQPLTVPTPPPRPIDHASYTAQELTRLLRQAYAEAEPRALEMVLMDLLESAVRIEQRLRILAEDK